jgi:sulfur relay (sulfurtransferase) complex TusBCD TusD component (DsrE family)
MHLGVLIATAPEEGDLPTLRSLLHEALQRGHDVDLFLMDAGVHYALDANLALWVAAGVDVTLCAHDAEAQGIDLRAAAARGVVLGTQRDHAQILRRSDRFYSFT